MASETKLILARFGVAFLAIVLGAASILLYEYFADGLLDEAAHRLSISYNSFSTSLAGN